MVVSKLPITETGTTNNAGTAKAVTMHLPAEDRQSSTFGSQNLNFQNEVPEIKFKSKELMALLIDDNMTNQQKFTEIKDDPRKYGLNPTLIAALEQDVINKDKSGYFKNTNPQAQLAKATEIMTRLNSSPLQLIMSLDTTLSPSQKLQQIRDGAIVDSKFLDTLPEDAVKAVALIQQKMIYKPVSETMEAKDLKLKRDFSPNPNSPTGENMVSKLTLNYGDLPEITVEWKIPKGVRSSEEIREALESSAGQDLAAEFSKHIGSYEDLFREISKQFTQANQLLSQSLEQRIAETDPEAARKRATAKAFDGLTKVFNQIASSGLTTLTQEELIRKFFAKLGENLEIEGLEQDTKYEKIFAKFDKDLTSEELSVKMTEAMRSVIKENLTPATIPDILNPSNYETHKEYAEAVKNNRDRGPEMLSNEDLQEKYKDIMEAGFGKNHDDANIPENQLVTQTITVNTANQTKLEFFPNKEVTGKEVKMPGGVVVYAAGAATKGASDQTLHLKSENGKFRLEINNGIISLFGPNKEGQEKLTAQINPSGVTLLFDENNTNTRTAFTLPTTNLPGTDRARQHFASSNHKYQQALKKKTNEGGFVPQNITNDGMIRAALSPFGGGLIFRPNGTFGTKFDPNGDIFRYPETVDTNHSNQFSDQKKLIL
jgi:hypothetical protein